MPPSSRPVWALLLLNVLLNLPFFLSGEYPYRDSIEEGYASMARFFSEHPNPFGWMPRQYNGMPSHLWYLPGMPYLAGFAMRLLPFLEPYHVYRIVAVSLACLGPVTLYLFIRKFGGDARWAAFGAICYTLTSFSYAIFPAINFDRGLNTIPWRIQALIKYGEGPHNAGLMLIPLALIALWNAARTGGFPRVFLAAGLLAAVCLTNWIAALSLAWCSLMMLLVWGMDRIFLRRALGCAALGYLLAAFWLTPRFVQTTLFNWPADAFNYKVNVAQYALLPGLLLVPVVLRIILRRAERYTTYLVLCLFGFAYVAAVHYWFGIDTIPESRRYALEMEFFGAALLAECFRRIAGSSWQWRRELVAAGVGCVVGLGVWQAGAYTLRTWSRLHPTDRSETPEWRMAKKLDELRPSGRVALSGGTRFRFNAWFDWPQLGGTFESGLRNRTPVWALYQLRSGMDSPPDRRVLDSTILMRLMGVEYVVIHGPQSKEHYRDIKNAGQFAKVWEEVYREGDDAIYRIPFRGLCHLVKPEELPAERAIGRKVPLGEAYVRALDDSARPHLDCGWTPSGDLEIRGAVPDGMWVSAQVSYDGGWEATQDGKELEVEHDAMDHILVKPSPMAATLVRLHYTPTREHAAMAGLSGLTWAGCIFLLVRHRRRKPDLSGGASPEFRRPGI